MDTPVTTATALAPDLLLIGNEDPARPRIGAEPGTYRVRMYYNGLDTTSADAWTARTDTR